MKFKPLLGIVALLIVLLSAIYAAGSWFPEEDKMLQSIRNTPAPTPSSAIVKAEMSNNSDSEGSFQISPDDSALGSVSSSIPEQTAPELTASDSSQSSSSLACSAWATTPVTEQNTPLTSSFSITQYYPREEVRIADPTNYGDRYTTDVYGRPARNEYIVVLHETVYSADSAINYFQTPHPNDADQASYHSLIRRDGTVVYVVPPEMRAFGAGNSVFNGPNGPETIKTKRELAPSVNNFAYHVSLETPSDGANDNRYHSGYSEAQYRSLAWLLAKTSIPESRITTHRLVDRSGSRSDPRSFNQQQFLSLLRAYPRTIRSAGVERCIMPSVAQQP